MLTIEEIRNTLPDKGKDLTDEQLLKLRDDMYGLARLCFDMWRTRQKQKKQAEEGRDTIAQ